MAAAADLLTRVNALLPSLEIRDKRVGIQVVESRLISYHNIALASLIIALLHKRTLTYYMLTPGYIDI